MQETDLAWAAGFFDGEGCIHIGRAMSRGHLNYQLFIRVTQRTREPIDRLHHLFGGFVTCANASSYTRRKQWLWGGSSEWAAEVLALLLPHLTVKSDQARLAIEFQQAHGPARPRDETTGRFQTTDKSRYQEFYERMRGLKVVIDNG